MLDGKYAVLIVTGALCEVHDPKVNPLLRQMLQSTGKFTVWITEEFRGATAETLADYDAVILNYDGKDALTSPYYEQLGADSERVLYDFVASGKSVLIYHSSALLGWQTDPAEYVKLVGAKFDPATGAGPGPKHGFRLTYKPGNPITDGIGHTGFLLQTEDQYLGGVYADDLQVIATVDDVPVIWTHSYGKGRVATITIGHGIDLVRQNQFVGLLCRTMDWLVNGTVTLPPPDVEFEKRFHAWPYYLPIDHDDFAALSEF